MSKDLEFASNSAPWIADMVEELLSTHPELGDLAGEESAELAVLTKEKAGKSGGVIEIGKVQKVSDQTQVMAKGEDPRHPGKEYKFAITIGLDEFTKLMPIQQRAYMFHLLLRCVVDYDEDDTALVKFGLRKPTVSAFEEELRRYGFWWKMDDQGKISTLDIFGDTTVVVDRDFRSELAAAKREGKLDLDFLLDRLGVDPADLDDDHNLKRNKPKGDDKAVEKTLSTDPSVKVIEERFLDTDSTPSDDSSPGLDLEAVLG